MPENLFTLLATIVGLLIGVLLTLLTGRYQTTHQLKLKLKEKLLDRRIDAHENILTLVNSLVLMNPLMAEVEPGKIESAINDEGELLRYPEILQSREVFGNFTRNWTTTILKQTHWLSNELVRELYLFQDYMVNLIQLLDKVEDSKVPIIGSIIRQDFIDFSTNITNLAYKYFYSDLEKLNLEDNTEWHKYKHEITKKRLFDTQLFLKGTLLSKFSED